MTGQCQNLSREIDGKHISLSQVTKCDQEGITATTFIGTSDCTQEENQIVMRGEWNQCKQISNEVFAKFTRY